MATNNFKAFGIGASANVTSQADYEALAALLTGFQSGKASSAQINKALRQSSTMAAVLGQFIAQAGLDALDNGNIASLLNNLINALTTNLSLGNASKRTVGAGTNQIPDMSFFPLSTGEIGYTKFPNGLILQWGYLSGSPSSGSQATLTGTYPIAFPTALMQLTASLRDLTGGTTAGISVFTNYQTGSVSLTTPKIGLSGSNLGTAISARYIALGY